MKQNKTALITGSAKRIGRAIALGLAEKGFNIALHYNASFEEANDLKREIESLDGVCKLFKSDLNYSSQVLSLTSEVNKEFENFNLLINNASVFEPCSFKETEVSFFDKSFNVNLKAPFFLMRDFANLNKEGHIINLLDTNVNQNKTGHFVYHLTKKSLFELTKLAAKDLAPNIRVNAIAPGPILPPPGQDEKSFEKEAKTIPMKSRGYVENVLKGINYLIENEFVTGECLYIDGGKHLL